MIVKNFWGQDWMGFHFLDQDWTWTKKFHSSLISGVNLIRAKKSITPMDLKIFFFA